MPIVANSFENYLRVKAISPSAFKSDSISTPAHYLAKKREKFKESPDTIFGKGFHCKILTPELYDKEFAELHLSSFGRFFKETTDGWPSFSDKNNKAIRDSFISKNPGKSIILPEHCEMMRGMSESVKNLPLIDKVIDLKNGLVETSLHLFAEFDYDANFVRFIDLTEEEYESMDPEIKLLFLRVKTRPDYFHKRKGFASDLKTTLTSHPKKFPREIWKHGYHVQAAFILDCLTAITGFEYDTFYFVAVEKSDPYPAMIYTCAPRMIDAGRDEYKYKLSMIKKAIDSEDYPAYEVMCPEQEIDGEIKRIPMMEIDLPNSYYYIKDQENLKNLYDSMNVDMGTYSEEFENVGEDAE